MRQMSEVPELAGLQMDLEQVAPVARMI